MQNAATKTAGLVLLAMLAVTVLLPSMSNAQQSLAKGFSPMELQSAGREYGYQRVRLDDGTKAERFELRHGDCPKSTGDCTADRNWIEFFEKNPAQKVGSEVWVAWTLHLPKDFPNKGSKQDSAITLGQFHQRGTSGPELMFTAFDGQLNLYLSNPHRLDDDPMNPIGPYRDATVASLKSLRGKVNQFMVHAR